MKTKFFAPLLLAAIISVVSCKDDDEKKDSAKTSMLIEKEWTLIKIVRNADDVTDNELRECNDDDIMKFSSNGTFVESTGAVKCDEEEDNYPGTWSWKEDETVLTLTYTGGAPYDWTVKQLTSTTLEIENYDADDEETKVLTYTIK